MHNEKHEKIIEIVRKERELIEEQDKSRQLQLELDLYETKQFARTRKLQDQEIDIMRL